MWTSSTFALLEYLEAEFYNTNVPEFFSQPAGDALA